MKRIVVVCLPVLLLVLAFPSKQGIAQGTFSNRVVQGMFGQRTLGRPLEAPPRSFTAGPYIGPTGDFLGVARPEGRLMFSSTPRSALGPIGPGGLLLPEPPRQLSSREALQLPVRVMAETPKEAPAGASVPGPWGQPPGATTPPSGPLSLPGAVQGPESPAPPGASPSPGATPGAAARTEPGSRAPGATPPTATPPAPGQTSAPTTGGASVAPAAEAPAPTMLRPSIGVVAIPARSDSAALLTSILERSRQIERRSALSVTVENDTAVVRGRVATERDRALAETLLLLEPGIWHVRNELVVEPAAAASQGSSGR